MATFALPSYTFVPPSYTYVPTAPRSKSTAAHGKPASSIRDKLHRSKLSGPALDGPQLLATATAAVDNDRGYRSGIQAETATFYNGNDSDNPRPIEEILYTALQKKGFTTEDQRLDNKTFRVEEATAEERGGFMEHNGSALGDNSARSLEDPIVQLRDDDSSASKARVGDNGLCTKSAALDAGPFDSPETAVDSTIPTRPSLFGWHNIDDFETPRLQLAEQEASTVDSMHPHASSSCTSSEPLNDHISVADQYMAHTRSEATMSHPAGPHSQLPDHLPTDRSAVDEHELVRPALNSDIFDEDRQRQEIEQGDEDYDNDIEDGNQPQQEVKEDVAAALMTGKVGDTHLSSGKDESPGLATCDPPPKPSEDKLGSYGDSWTDDEFDNNSESEKDNTRRSPTKRKRLSSSNNGSTQKKRKHHLEPKSTRQHRSHSKLHQHYRKSHSSPDQGLRVVIASSGEGQFPSPAPSAPQTMDMETPRDCNNLGGLSGDLLPTLTEVTFRPHSQHCYSFSAVVQDGYDEQGVSFSQLAQLIKSIGHVGKINDFKIKPLQQHSFLVTGFSQYTSSQLSSSGMILSTAAVANLIPNDVPSTILKYGRAIDTDSVVAQRGSESASSDDDSGSSDDDSCSSEVEQKRSSMRMNVPWEGIDEQRLLAYKKEGQSWEWIFGKFPGRTRPAIRTRWNMIRPRGG